VTPELRSEREESAEPKPDRLVERGATTNERRHHGVASRSVDQWEYKVEVIDNTGAERRLASVLNLRGSEGWELVSLAPRVKSAIGNLTGGDLFAVFKRPGVGKFDRDLAEPPAY
jgi:hypothetical protein